jgi:hypothetical protein
MAKSRSGVFFNGNKPSTWWLAIRLSPVHGIECDLRLLADPGKYFAHDTGGKALGP